MLGRLKRWLAGNATPTSTQPTKSRLGLERLEPREVPAVTPYVVNTEYDTPDANTADGNPLDAMGRVSLRAVIQQVNALANPNTEGYLIEFANVKGQSFLRDGGDEAVVVMPTSTTVMTIPLGSQLPTVAANRILYIFGSTTRRVTITRQAGLLNTDTFCFLDIAANGAVEVNGLKLTDALNDDGVGGAIHNALGGTLSVVNCEFRNNVAVQGGAIANSGTLMVGTGDPYTPSAERSWFFQNRATDRGGAIVTGDAGGLAGTSEATITNAVFEDNEAYDADTQVYGEGGAVAYHGGGTVSITYCAFEENQAKLGGAIFSNVAAQPTPTLTVSYCDLNSNSAEGNGGDGGAAYVSTTNAKFYYCNFDSNSAERYGGSIFLDPGKLTLDHCTFIDSCADGQFGSQDVAVWGAFQEGVLDVTETDFIISWIVEN